MNLIKIYFGLKLIPFIFLGLCVIGLILYFIYTMIQVAWDSKFKKNCHECEHYKYIRGGCGKCVMKCFKTDKIDYGVDMNENYRYRKCDNFEKRTIK